MMNQQNRPQQQQPIQQPSAAGCAPVTASPFRRLATVELQLIMQHCDLKSLLALARCSRFTLQAASNPFAWRALSPLSFPTTAKGLGVRLHDSRLLAHCDVALRWLPPTNWFRQAAVGDAELAAIERVPRLVQLDVGTRLAKKADLRRLLSHPALAGLTALHCHTSEMDDSCTALLPLHQPRLRTLTLRINRDSDANHGLLTPLPLLPSLTDLSLDGSGIDESATEMISHCSSLRRLHLSSIDPAVLFTVLTAPARARLESLSLFYVDAVPPRRWDTAAAAVTPMSAADVKSWRACFENLQILRSLSLQHCTGHEVIFAGAAAALATGSALRSLTALRADTLKMNNADGSLIPLLAAHCPQLRRLHIYEIDGDSNDDPGALAGLPLLGGLTDLRLQSDGWRANDDELAVGRCASLTRLHLTNIRPGSLHSILLSPQMQQLESLTLGSVRFDRDNRSESRSAHSHASSLDWSLCFANLRSLRALNLQDCHGGDQLLAAVQAACPPLLYSIRFNHRGYVSVDPEMQLLSALLVQLPSLRVGLVQGAPPLDGLAYRSIDRAGQVDALDKAFHKLKRRNSARVTITQLDRGDSDPFGSWSD